MRGLLSTIKKSAFYSTAIALLLVAQIIPFTSFWQNTAEAAPVCTNDTQGPNDEPGQKDLNKLCIDYAGLPNTAVTTWNWDETGTNGANTMDACSLFDTDNDGNINYAVCVTTQNDPATLQTTTTYSCGDAKIDRCTSPATPVSNGTTSCAVTQVTNDPFPGPPNSAKGDSYPKDTQGSCTVQLSTVGGSSARLVDVCSYPSSQPNSDPSDCVIIADNKAKIEVKKVLSPNTDPGLFDLKINGTLYANDIGDGGTTGEQVLASGSVTVLEAEGPSTDLANYTTTVVCRDLNGTGSIVGQSSPTGADTRQLQITAADQSDIVCTFTNTIQKAYLKVVKDVTNDNGGTKTYADFTFKVNNGSAQSFNATTSPDGEKLVEVTPGTYSIVEVEANQNGYATTYNNCTNVAVTTLNTSTNPAVCTITNNDIAPTLTVVKNVVNDNGGTATVSTFGITNNNGNLTFDAGVPSGTTTTYTATPTVAANTNYTLSELDVTGYEEGLWSCTDQTQGTGRNVTVNLALDEDVTCTVTNNDIAPKVTLVKVVTNDDGGNLQISDFPLYVGNTLVVSGVQNSFNAGNYTLSETQQPGYTAGQWTGTGCNLGNITLEVGGVYTCTITNDDQPANIKVTKIVENDNGGNAVVSDFELNVNSTEVVSGANNTFPANQAYTVSESSPSGYTQVSLVCNDVTDPQNPVLIANGFTAVNGRSYHCVITNNDVAPTLTVIKEVINDNGGTAVVNDFDIKLGDAELTFGTGVVNGTKTTYTATPTVTSNVTLNLSEIDLTGYTEGTWSCTNEAKPSGRSVSFSLNEGQNVTCTITNNDDQATLIVKKVLTNDNGGTAEKDDFSYQVNAGSAEAFEADGTNEKSVNAGTYNVVEVTPVGYAISYDNCSNIQLAVGETETCTITNNDIAPTLRLKKVVINDNGGNNLADEWTLTADGNDASTPINAKGTAIAGTDGLQAQTAVTTVKAGVTYTLSESGPAGYGQSSWVCDGGTLQGNVLTLALAATVTCTITNDDTAPKLTLYKVVVDEYGDAAEPQDWTLYATPSSGAEISGNGLNGVIDVAAQANVTYILSESNLPGYTPGSWVCNAEAGSYTNPGGSATLQMSEGADIACYITNTAQAPTLIVIKKLINDNGGTSLKEANFTINVTGTDVSTPSFSAEADPGTAVTLDEGTYKVTELENEHYVTTYSTDCEGTIAIGETKVCTVTNNDKAPRVFVEKQTYPNGSNTQFDFTIKNNDQQYADFGLSDNGIYNTGLEGLVAGTVEITESPEDGWFQKYVYCYQAQVSYDLLEGYEFDTTGDQLGTSFPVVAGEDYYCKFVNEQFAKVNVTKFHDLDQDGIKDKDEPTLPDWEMNLDGYNPCYSDRLSVVATDVVCSAALVGYSEFTNEAGVAVFTDIEADTYYLSETLQEGWDHSSIYCEYENGYGYAQESNKYYLNLYPGEEVDCFVGNYRSKYFNIEKTNNQPNPVPVGTEVIYTITVSVPEDSGRIYGLYGCEEEPELNEVLSILAIQEPDTCEDKDVTVIDWAPAKFTYTPGSFTAISNVRGNLVSNGITTEPTYPGPARWYLTNEKSQYLAPGEVVTLTYRTVIGDVAPGDYPDIALAFGYNRYTSKVVVANVPQNETPFVGSVVTVYQPAPGAVLGVSTLENTGIDLRIAVFLATSVISVALFSTLLSRRNGHRKLLIGLLVFGLAGLGIAFNSQSASAATYWAVKMSAPTVFRQDGTVNIDYQVAAALPDSGETYTVSLLQNGVSTGLSQVITNENGGVGSFTPAVTTEGSYTYQVSVLSSTSGTKTSQTETVVYDKTAPATPVLVSKVRVGDTYTLTINVPANAEPGTLEIYASQSANFTADTATKIGSVNYVPGQTLTYSFTKPGTDYYVAARTVDSNGNTSAFAVENAARVALATAAGAAVASTGVVSDTAASTIGGEDTEVLAATNENNTGMEEPENESDSNDALWWTVLVIVVLGTGGYIFYNWRKTKNS